MSREINELAPVVTLDTTALFEIEQFGSSFRTNLFDMLALHTTNLSEVIIDVSKDWQGFDITNLGNLGVTGFLDLEEITTPANPPVNTGRIYVKDLAGTETPFFLDSSGTDSNLLLAQEFFVWTANHDAAGFQLVNPSFADGTFPTKILNLVLSGMNAGISLNLAVIQTTTQTLTIPDVVASDTFVTELHIQTLENKTIDFASNTITTTFAELNTAVSDATLVDLDDVQTLTNKSIDLANNTITGTTAEFNTALSDGDFATLAGIETLTNKTIDTASNTITIVKADISDFPIQTGDIADDAVTLAKIQNIATNTILGRVTGGSGIIEELTGTQATTLLDTFTDVLKGLAPASGGGTTNFLRADGTWISPSGAGEQNTISSDGGGLGLTATISKVGVDLRVRSLAATSPLNVAEATDLITFTIDLLVNADIAASAGIVNSKLADIATATLLGRVSGGSGVREELSGTQATTLLDTFTDALKGLAPASGGGTANFLRADGSWDVPPGIASGDMILAAIQTVTGAKTFADDAFLIQNPGATFEYLFQGAAIVADRTVNLPILTGNDTFVFEAHTQTLTNKSIDLANNTLSTTFAQLNTAVSDATLVDLDDVQTLTNKTLALGSNTISGTTAQFNTALTDGDFATLAGTETLTNKTINLANNTLTTTFAQLNTAVSDATLVDLDDAQTLTNKTINSASNTITITKSDISDFPIVTADITDDAVTFAKTQNIATDRFLGRITAGTGNIEELTPAQATSMLDQFTVALQGVVPLSGGGTTNFLRADGTWADPMGTATVTKSGTDSIARNGTTSVVFNTAFATAPNVVVCFEGNVNYLSGEKGAVLSVYSISTTGFTVRYDEPDGSGPNPGDFQWFASVAGDP